ncbi:hypothetical protein DV737_g5470, partial [Chaetothyriales sp. CBS 132003]
MEETSTFNPAALTRSDTITSAAAPKNTVPGSSSASSGAKAAKSAHSYPRIDFEPLYTELKSLIADHWHIYHDALTRFIQGQLSASEFSELCDHFLLSTAATEHAHNSLICAIIHNAGRDGPEPGLAAFISLASDKANGGVSSKHAMPSSDGAEQRLKAEIMALPARERRRLKAITTDASAIATEDAAQNWSLEIRKRYALPLFSESLEFPDSNAVQARIVPICYEAGLVSGAGSQCAELIQTATETFLKNMLHDIFNRVRANGPRYENGAGSGIFTGHFKRQVLKEEAEVSAGRLSRNRDDGMLPVESRAAQNRRPLSVADLRLATAVGPTLFNGMPTVGASVQNMLFDIDFPWNGRAQAAAPAIGGDISHAANGAALNGDPHSHHPLHPLHPHVGADGEAGDDIKDSDSEDEADLHHYYRDDGGDMDLDDADLGWEGASRADQAALGSLLTQCLELRSEA